MKFKNTSETYGLVAQIFHWLIAVALLVLFKMGWDAEELSEGAARGTPEHLDLIALHKTVGIIILGLIVLRILWALTNPKPFPLNYKHKAESFLSGLVLRLLYLAMIFVPLAGWLGHSTSPRTVPASLPGGGALPFLPASRELSGLFMSLHKGLLPLLLILIVLHLLGAIKHVVIDRDSTLKRMIPFWYKEGTSGISDYRGTPSLQWLAAIFVIVAVFIIILAPRMI